MKRQGDVCPERACCKHMFRVFCRYVASVLYRCCKSRSKCCICCNGCTLMLQTSAPNVSSVFSDVCCKCVYLDVAYVSHICCKFFIWMLHIVAMVFQGFYVFLSVLDACFKRFICLQTYVASVIYVCFKSRSGIASPSSPWCLLLAFCCLACFSN